MDKAFVISLLGWASAVIGVTGGIFNVLKKRVGFLFYIAANVLIISAALLELRWYNVILFSVYMVLAVWGFIRWGKNTTSH